MRAGSRFEQIEPVMYSKKTADDSRRGPGRVRLLAALWAGLAAGACSESSDTFAPLDEGPGPLTCATTTDCQGTGVCVAGLCTAARSCSTDSGCSGEGKFCHQQRFFCVECDGRSGQCGDNQTCQFDFTCSGSGGGSDAGPSDGGTCSGSCGGRADCAPDRVCRNGTCCAPPTRCASDDDCPESQPQCNGATGQCFGGAGCFQDSDCDGQPGCAADACICEIRGAPPGTCRLRPDECQNDQDCFEDGVYVRRYCALNAQPRRCLDSVSCRSDLECANFGLVCDLQMGSPSFGYCINGRPCPNGTECDPSSQLCVNGVCVGANCINQPSRCAPTEMCDTATGQCVPVQSGACTRDTDCPQGQYCNLAISPSRCENGCRSNADCPGGVCNVMHQCEYPSNAICGPCSRNSDCPPGTQCIDIAGSALCREPCLTSQSCSDPNRQCLLFFCSCLF